MPLDQLLGTARNLRSHRLRTDLVHTSVTIVCLGLAGAPPAAVRDVTWLYTADPGTPFFRVFFPRSFSDKLVPDPASTWSLIAEMSSSPQFPRTLGEDPVAAAAQELRRLGLLGESTVVSSAVRCLSHGYPVPSLDRDRTLSEFKLNSKRYACSAGGVSALGDMNARIRITRSSRVSTQQMPS